MAVCGCNVAFYLAYLRESISPGRCDGDYYCDANEVTRRWVVERA